MYLSFLTISKDCNSVVNLRKFARNNPNLDLVMVNAYAKFDQSPSIHFQATEQKRNSDDNEGL